MSNETKTCGGCKQTIAARAMRCPECEMNQPGREAIAAEIIRGAGNVSANGARVLAALAAKIAADKRAKAAAAELEAAQEDACPECEECGCEDGKCPGCERDARDAKGDADYDRMNEDGEDDIRDASDDGAELDRGY